MKTKIFIGMILTIVLGITSEMYNAEAVEIVITPEIQEVVETIHWDPCGLKTVYCQGEEKPEFKPSMTQEEIDNKNVTEIRQLVDKYFTENDREIAKKIIQCESRYNARAHNYNPKTFDNSYGLFQINLLGALFPDRLIRAEYLGYDGEKTVEALGEWLMIQENNIMYAASMKSTARRGWGEWSCMRKI